MMAKAKKQENTKNIQQTQEETQVQKENQTQGKPKKEPVMYTGEPVVNDKFFLRPGQIFMEIPAYIKDKKLKEKFVPVSQVKNK